MDALEYLQNLQPNFITNIKVKTAWLIPGEYAYELSRGDALGGGTLWGVTITKGNAIKHDLSESFTEQQAALAYIDALRHDLEVLAEDA